jgi:hypothetical protein
LSIGSPVSPFAPFEYRTFVTRALGFLSLPALVKSGIRPGPGDPTAWYDRAIRIVGGGLILLVFGGGLIVVIIQKILQAIGPQR